MKIVNLTQHNPTQEQIQAGVFNLPQRNYDSIKELITFSSDYTYETLLDVAQRIRAVLKYDGIKAAMIGGMPSFMPVLEKELLDNGISVYYAKSERVSEDQAQEDGTVRKVAIFKHAGFYIVHPK